MSQITILSYYRKGLGQLISQKDNFGVSTIGDPTRATLNLKAPMSAVSATDGQDAIIANMNREFALVGPADVKGINESIVRKVVPTSDVVPMSNNQIPYIEFYEPDFPWRYTPLSPNGDALRPWIALVACREGEFSTSIQDGVRMVTLNQNILPDIKDLHLWAHVQRISNNNNEITDELSRVLCHNKLDEDATYTIFLVPSFKQGAERKTEGISIQQGAWDNSQNSPITLPIYYQWSIKTAKNIQFDNLANKMNAITIADYSLLQDSLRIDISDTGLHPEFSAIDKEEIQATEEDRKKLLIARLILSLQNRFIEQLDDPNDGIIPMAVALSKTNKGAKSENNDLITHNRELISALQKELQELLELSPVFQKNAQEKNKSALDEDPWVVPPVYAARQLLSDTKDLKNGLLYELNLELDNRMAAGLGATVVQENQEEFVHRAWQRVEDVNRQNNIIRQITALIQQNEIANRRVATRRKGRVSANHRGLISDTAMRVALNSSIYSSADFIELVNSPNTSSVDTAKGSLLNKSSESASYTLNSGEITKNIMSHVGESASDFAHGIYLSELRELLSKDFWQNSEDAVKLLKSLLFTYDEDSTEWTPNRISQYLWDIHSNFYPIKHVLQIGQQEIVSDAKNKQLGKWCFQISDTVNPDYLEGRSSYFNYYMTMMECISNFNVLNHLFENTSNTLKVDKGSDLQEEVLMLDLNALPYGMVLSKNLNITEKYCKTLDKIKVDVTNSGQANLKGLLLCHEDFVKVAGDKYHSDLKIISVNYAEDISADDNSILYIFDATQLHNLAEGGVKYYMISDEIELVFNKNSKRFKLADSCIGKNIKLGDKDVKIQNCDLIKNSTKYKNIELFIDAITDVKNNKSYKWINDYQSKEKSLFVDEYLDESVTVRAIECLNIKVDVENVPNYNIYVPFLISKDSYIKERKNTTISLEQYWINKANSVKRELDELSDLLCAPTYISVDITGLEILHLTFNTDCQITRNDYLKAISEAAEGLSAFKAEQVEQKEVEIDLPIDFATEQGKARIKEICDKYYDNRSINEEERLMQIACSKYPIMAYPEFPDPTYFYLRELSQKFILPSIDSIKLNTISCFLTNPKFEEAFLAGMNTEMGHELLWREYPTDERGSYFRKFWDSLEMPDNLDDYFDIKEMHLWKNSLGHNHTNSNSSAMYAFVVRSELMRAYPDTKIFVTSCQDNGEFYVNNLNNNVLEPLMGAWLNNDTYIVGFSKTKIDNIISTNSASYLAFQELPQGLRFELPSSNTVNSSAAFAITNAVKPTVWGIALKGLINK